LYNDKASSSGVEPVCENKNGAALQRHFYFASSFQLPASSFQLPASSFQLPASSNA
jgi:hypothetical protein